MKFSRRCRRTVLQFFENVTIEFVEQATACDSLINKALDWLGIEAAHSLVPYRSYETKIELHQGMSSST